MTIATMEITGTDSAMDLRPVIEMVSGASADLIDGTMIDEIAITMTMTREGVDVTNRFFEIGAWRRARGYFGAAECLRDFEIL